MKIILIVVALLAGCSTTWTHPVKGQAGFDADLYRCDVEAAPVQDRYRAAVMRQNCMQLKGWRAQ